MSLPISCQILSHSVLSQNTTWDLHPFQPSNSPVFQSAESIERVGLLYVPIVHATSSGKYDFFTGRRSVNYLFEKNATAEICCRILPQITPKVQLLAILFEEYSTIKEMSQIELAYFYQLCKLHLTSEEMESLLSSIGLQYKPHYVKRMIELTHLELPLQLGLLDGSISENVARDLLLLSQQDRLSVFALFAQFTLGGGKQKRLLSLLRDLAGRTETSIEEYLQEAPIQSILNHQSMNVPQKSSSLMQYLQLQLSPSLSNAENSFRTWEKSFGLPLHCSLEHSQAFEQDCVTFSVQCENKTQFESFWKNVQHFIPPTKP